MEQLNSYFGMGINDYMYARGSVETSKMIGNYNGTAALCAQSCEKFLKAIVENCFLNEDQQEILPLLRTHNLRPLYNKIVSKYTLSVTSKDCKWLGDFYFDARYPGDHFVEVTEEDALECLAILEKVKTDAENILKKDTKKREAAKRKLDQFKCF